MTQFHKTQLHLAASPKSWLITGVAGFIGSNILEALLKLNQTVRGLDNFATGHQANLDEVRKEVTKEQWRNFDFCQGDIRQFDICSEAVRGVDYVLHQAALGSVPRSIAEPIVSNAANITGFLNMLHAAKEEGVSSFTYAASSSTYGDHPALPKVEEHIGRPLSPYAVTKYVNELYAAVYARNYGFKSIGLRYFNVFGERQDPNGPYAAVIPKWISAAILGENVVINGDGETSRDFCYVQNAVQMNILAAISPEESRDEVYNVAVGDRTSLNDLNLIIRDELRKKGYSTVGEVKHADFRAGDVRHSQADIRKAKTKLGYDPQYNIASGIAKSVDWYLGSLLK